MYSDSVIRHRFSAAGNLAGSLDPFPSILSSEIASPAVRMARSMAVPAPSKGGIESRPVNKETTPVPASANTNGIEVIADAFTTASPPFHAPT